MINRYAPPARDREEKKQDRPEKATVPTREREEKKYEDRRGRERDNDSPGVVFIPDVILGTRRYPDGWDARIQANPSITFVRTRADGTSELCALDDQGLATVTFGPRYAGGTDPSRAQRTGRLAYVLVERERRTLWSVDARLRKPRRLSGGDWGDVHEPAWSPDEKRLAFAVERDGASAVYTARADGKQLRRLAAVGRLSRQPVWSRDGRWIVFVGQEGASTALYRVASSGGDPQRLAGLPQGSQTDPALSPDGRTLAFVASGLDGAGRSCLCLADPQSGAVVRRLVEGDGAKIQPAFHPTQPRLAFALREERAFAIHDIRLTDGNVRRLSPGNEDETCPTWW